MVLLVCLGIQVGSDTKEKKGNYYQRSSIHLYCIFVPLCNLHEKENTDKTCCYIYFSFLPAE